MTFCSMSWNSDRAFFISPRLGAAGRHGDGQEAVVAEGAERQAGDGHAGGLQRAAVQAGLVEAELAVPAQMWVDERERSAVGGAAGGDHPLIGTARRHGVGTDA